MTKLRIGIPVSDQYDSVGVRKDLVKFASTFGAVSFLIGYRDVDAIFLPGGSDVNPAMYKKGAVWQTGKPDLILERFDTNVLTKYIGKVPIFGICRGLQILNVLYGGTLKQHIFNHPYSDEDNELVHDIHTSESNKNEFEPFLVNSFHHQGIGKLGEALTPIAKHGNLVEAFENTADKVFAVQWHPERMYDKTQSYYDAWTVDRIRKLIEK